MAFKTQQYRVKTCKYMYMAITVYNPVHITLKI